MSILQKIEGSRFSFVQPLWKNKPVVILGGGPSLSDEQVAQVEVAHQAGIVKCVAVNDGYLRAPFADAVYFADSHWWVWQVEGRPKPTLKLSAAQVRERWAEFKGQRCTIQNSGANVTDDSIHMMRNRDHPNHGNGVSFDPEALVTGRSSGFQGLNLSVLAGSNLPILCGFDGQPDPSGKSHWFGSHERPTPSNFYPEMRRAFSLAEVPLQEASIRVINCSPISAINTFEKMPLPDALEIAARWVE